MINGKQLLIASVAGLACGKAIRVSQDNPSTAKTLLSYSVISSVAGATLGVGVAYYRKAPLHVYSLSVGANFALGSFAFFGVRHVLLQHFRTPRQEEESGAGSSRLSPWQQEYLCSICSGGVAGTLASLLSRHSLGLLASTGVGGLVVGGLGQWLYFTFHRWRKKRGVLLEFPHLDKPHREWTLNAFQEWFLGFWHQRSKVVIVQSEITLLQHDIAEEQKKIASLDEELAALNHTELDSRPRTM